MLEELFTTSSLTEANRLEELYSSRYPGHVYRFVYKSLKDSMVYLILHDTSHFDEEEADNYDRLNALDESYFRDLYAQESEASS